MCSVVIRNIEVTHTLLFPALFQNTSQGIICFNPYFFTRELGKRTRQSRKENLHQSNCKHTTQGNSRFLGHMQSGQNQERKCDYNKIAGYIKACVREPKRFEINALSTAGELLVECILNRVALKNAGEDSARAKGYNDADTYPGGFGDPRRTTKNPDVQQQDADFGQGNVYFVQNLGEPVELGLQSQHGQVD
jgi:hypothetical protein